MSDQPDPSTVSVDDAWLGEWAAEGIAGLERLLAAHAAFDAYLRDRQDCDHGHDTDED